MKHLVVMEVTRSGEPINLRTKLEIICQPSMGGVIWPPDCTAKVVVNRVLGNRESGSGIVEAFFTHADSSTDAKVLVERRMEALDLLNEEVMSFQKAMRAELRTHLTNLNVVLKQLRHSMPGCFEEAAEKEEKNEAFTEARDNLLDIIDGDEELRLASGRPEPEVPVCEPNILPCTNGMMDPAIMSGEWSVDEFGTYVENTGTGKDVEEAPDEEHERDEMFEDPEGS